MTYRIRIWTWHTHIHGMYIVHGGYLARKLNSSIFFLAQSGRLKHLFGFNIANQSEWFALLKKQEIRRQIGNLQFTTDQT